MILDSSAVIAVIVEEPGWEALLHRMTEAPVLAIGSPTLVETAIVLSSRLGRDARALLNEFLRKAEVEVVPFTQDHYEIAVDAFRRYGKGNHPAALDFGDCLTYAVASQSGLPLIFTGEDFAKTDLPSATC